MLKLTKLLFIIVCLTATTAQANNSDVLRKVEALSALRAKILDADVMDKFRLNEEYTDTLRSMLNDYASFEMSYDTLSTNIFSVVSSPKGDFRIYTWAIEEAPNSYIFYGFTQYLLDKRKKELKVCLLTSEKVNNQQFQTLDTSQWMGCIYYELIPRQKRREDKYLILGWDGNTSLTNKKIIEVIEFNKKGIPTFGANVFRTTEFRPPRGNKNYRLVIEYSGKVSMTIRWDDQLEMIVFDHLSPSSPRLKGVRAAYVPDFSYDALVYENGYWVQKSNVDARNQKLPKPKKYKPEDYEK